MSKDKQGQMDRIDKIEKAIAKYAKAYNTLEGLQKSEQDLPDRLIPIGDQKTGAIGEFYAVRYLKEKYPGAEVKLKPSSNHRIDIDVTVNGHTTTVQVKTVSHNSKTRTLSPLHGGYDELHLILLEKDFTVAHYWVTENEIIGQSLRMPDPDRRRRGSVKLTGLVALSSAELKALRGEEEATIRYRAKNAVIRKLKQVRYIYGKRIKRYQGKIIERLGLDTQYDCYPFDIDLGCFLTHCRSILQYILKEANNVSENRKLYNDFVGQSPIFGFFKGLRDAEIHTAPGSHQVRSEVKIVLPMHVKNEQELKEWQAKNTTTTPKILEFDYHLRKVVTKDGDLHYEEQELDGENDLFVLCEKYLDEIERFVNYCCEKEIIS